ncbi:MAG: ABC transporter permease [Gammaproteobacteria bacterium]|nr:ABC transporter permease [Gammaproteobacteria bacterium]MBU1443439.1 ABC transporter permease [Gammaproteobacteria bacterium]MBU2285245.1 ABC transporter permease [Gammaproteobacteria bacterium]MBU2410912.1 ABC transporter permease [Gammaproteobacteria bacterium]
MNGGAPLTARQFWLLSLAGAASFLVFWSAAALSGLTPRAFLPAPWDVVQRLVELISAPFAGHTLQSHLLSSIQRFAAGFCLAVVVGIPLGLAMAWFRWVDRIVTPLFEGIRFVAPIAWVPFAALWFGTGIGGPVLIIFMGAFPPVLINTYRGARGVDVKYIEASQMLGIGSFRTITQVLLPAAFPSIVAGLRISAGLGWQSLVGAELIVASSGVGYLLVKGQASVSTATVMSGMIAIGIVGLLIDVALRRFHRAVERRLGA